MDRNIQIEIKDRIAHLVGNPKIICGNNDYSVTFAFDDEWAGVDVKTLRVSYNNKYSDHVFTGDTVELPPIIKAVEVYLGVFAGDITSTRVAVRAEPSILCSGGSVADPEPDVYHQLIELINSKEPSGGSGGGITQETDPTVQAWAKEPQKPKYTAEEVGALPKDTPIPEPYTLPTASETVKGGVMVGGDFVMDGETLRHKPENEYELIETVAVGYKLLAEKPDDWDANWAAYYSADLDYGVQALSAKVPWEPYKYYVDDIEYVDVKNVKRTHMPDGTPYDLMSIVFKLRFEKNESSGKDVVCWCGDKSVYEQAATFANALNGGVKWGATTITISNGYSNSYATSSANSVSAATALMAPSVGRYLAKMARVSQCSIAAQGGANLPKGSVFEIWGVRA